MSRSCMLVLLLTIIGACYASIEYSVVSKTLHGKPCLSSCRSGKCFIDQYLIEFDCTADHFAGVPIHSTMEGYKKCLSNCGTWGKGYMWCYTSEYYDWDYCNDEIRTPGLNPGRDYKGRRCVDDCNVYPSSNALEGQCHLASQQYVYCTRAGHVPVQTCAAIFSTSPPQTQRSRRTPLDKIFSGKYCSASCRGRYRDGRNGETQEMVDAVYTTYAIVNNTTFPASSPYRFSATTTVLNANNEQVVLPLILEARMENPVYSPRGDKEVSAEGITNVNRMYNVRTSADRPGIHVGHLLAYSNGGTADVFNYVGQTAALNDGPYKTMENWINNWLRAGYVDFRVVVEYTGTRPSTFYVKLTFYNRDGSIHSDCLDMVFTNA